MLQLVSGASCNIPDSTISRSVPGHENVWLEYERLKNTVAAEAETPEEYEVRIATICKRLGI